VIWSGSGDVLIIYIYRSISDASVGTSDARLPVLTSPPALSSPATGTLSGVRCDHKHC
jgi:hypothetical protein